MAIIGGWRIKYLKARQRPKTKSYKAYARRNEALPYLGYATYREYLASDAWKEIRGKLLACHPRCFVCPKSACVVHHMSYDDRTMLGLDMTWLICLCDGCHEKIEVEQGGRKRTLREANAELLTLAWAAGRAKWVAHTRRTVPDLHPSDRGKRNKKRRK